MLGLNEGSGDVELLEERKVRVREKGVVSWMLIHAIPVASRCFRHSPRD